jgi:hypothetical protein
MGADLPPSAAPRGAAVGRKRRNIVIRRNPPGELDESGRSARRGAVYAPPVDDVNRDRPLVCEATDVA